MPMYLGTDRVKGMYLGDSPYDGFALGTNTSTFDYGVDVYAMPPGTSDEANWTINQGLFFKGNDATGMWFSKTNSAAPNVQSPTYTTVVGRKYQSIVSRPTGGASADTDTWAHQVFQGGVGLGGALDLSLDQGDVSILEFTATSTNTYIQLFSFIAAGGGEKLYLDEVYLKEVK